ncbi:MAG: hypothetical protein ACE5IL_10665 [Myxococcota bacterium]
MRRIAVLVLGLTLAGSGASHAQSFTAFESGPVRPLALSADGSRLYVANIPDDSLEIFATDGGALRQLESVPVGLEPVAVAVRSPSEVWVVNHQSDSVSIVDVASSPPRVVRTLLVGDEPRDIVFAGSAHDRAFITTAHRGQNSPVDPQLKTPGVGRADVWVFDANALGSALGGTPLGIATLFGDTPRSLAASADGSSVYVGIFHSGNQSTAVNVLAVEPISTDPNGAQLIPPMPPFDDFQNVPAPSSGIIVRKRDVGAGPQWVDAAGNDWSAFVPFDLPDQDVFRLDANASPATMASTATVFSGVGTILFDIAVGPTGKVYVANTEAFNHVRFEGFGVHAAASGAPSPPSLRGHLHESHITVIDGASVLPRHLNKHIDYQTNPVPAGVNARSLALPVQLELSADGSTIYVAAFGSSKVGIFDAAALEADTFTPDDANHIDLSGGGPAGLALDEGNGRLYVLTRFDDSVSVVDTATRREIRHVALHNPEPASIVDGRPILYDARFSSDRGDTSCASCHVFARMDDLAWNLGNPDVARVPNPNPQIFDLTNPLIQTLIGLTPQQASDLLMFHGMKGPMTTQTIRGLSNHPPMHWRGDRSGGITDPNAVFDAAAGFKRFNVAFDGLLGGVIPTDAIMQKFADFILQVKLPPSPIRNLDNTLSPTAASGENIFKNVPVDANQTITCEGCHTLDEPNGFFGTDGLTSFEGEDQLFKVPHLRNMYQKVGFFGFVGEFTPIGPQIRGFGFLHDGSVDTLLRFVSAPAFVFPGSAAQQDQQRNDLVDFLHAFPTDLAPIVGQEITRTATNGTAVDGRIQLLAERASLTAPEADLVAHAVVGGQPRGWLLTGADTFIPDAASDPIASRADLLALAASPGQEVTFLAVPPGSGMRVGIDRDEDGVRDGDDNCRIVANASQSDAGASPAGDACECGDQSGDGLVSALDATQIGSCVAGSIACATLCDADHDGACDAGDVTSVQLAVLGQAALRCAAHPF